MLRVRLSGRGVVLGILIAISLAFLTYSQYARDAERKRKVAGLLPDSIQISDVIFVEDDGGFRESCGAAIFRLSDSTKSALERHGLSYLKSATKPAASQNFIYNDWQITPIPQQWTTEGLWYGLDCVEGEDALVKRVFEQANRAGGYYTHASPNRRLVVLPALGVVVYSWG